MVLDYSDKKTVRDGLERKPLQKNRPRRDSSRGMFALLSVAVLAATFGAGVGTGWFLKKVTTKTPPPAPVAQPVKKDEPAPLAAGQPKPGSPEAPLTFYKTLPAGGKGALGSGMNLKKPEPPAAQHPAPAPAAAVPAAAPAPSAPAPPAAPRPEAKQPGPQYVVQVASYRNKTEADAAQGKLAAKGIAAYVVETKVPDKGVWYRLRAGKHLSKAEADDLAAKSGKGAVVVAE